MQFRNRSRSWNHHQLRSWSHHQLRILLLLFAVISLASASDTNTASILTSPVSQNVTVFQGQIIMSCEAQADGLMYLINDESGDLQSVQEKGFIQQSPENMGQGKLKRELAVFLKKEKAGENFLIRCRGFNYAATLVPVDSDSALLNIQGSLNKPQDLTVTYSSSYLLISWTPPPTMIGTVISGYNITVNSEPYTFTEDNEIRINYSDFSPCDSLDITVSAYNGVDGEIATLPTQYIPSNPANDVHLPVTISEVTTDEDNELLFTVNVSSLDCKGQRPSDIHVSVSPSDDTKNPTKYKLTLVPSDSSNDILVSEEPIEVKKDKEYYISIEFSNPLGIFQSNTNFYLCLIPGKQQNKHIASLTSCNSETNPTSISSERTTTNQLESNPTDRSISGSNNDALGTKSSKTLAYLIMLLTVCFLIIF